MRNRDLVLEILQQIEGAASKIVTRFRTIRQKSDFTDSPAVHNYQAYYSTLFETMTRLQKVSNTWRMSATICYSSRQQDDLVPICV